MKKVIAVTYENGNVFQHFGHTEQFQLFTTEDGKIISDEVVSTNGNGHSLLADFLVVHGVSVLICGGIGGGAKQALAEKNIALFGGVSGETKKAVEDYLAGNLAYNPDVACSHHGEHDHEHCGEHDHNCGSHDHHCGH